MTAQLTKYIAVYLAGALGIYKGVPAGIALGVPTFYTALLTSLGAISSALAVYFAGEKFRTWLLNRYGEKSIHAKKERFTRWMDKYGVAGLGLMVTGLLGPFIALLIGMLLLTDTRKFLLYLLAGIVVWSFGIAYLSAPLVEFAKSLW